MTTIVSGRRPLDQNPDSSIHTYTRKSSLGSVQQFNPISSVQRDVETTLEPPYKRRKLGNDDLATDQSIYRPMDSFPTSTNTSISYLSPKSLVATANKQIIYLKDCRSSQVPPRPNQKGYQQGPPNSSVANIRGSPLNSTVPVKPYIPETPPLAPHCPKSSPADYFPWTGCHPEDVLNESAARNGFYDRLPASHSESGTARPSLWNGVKHRSGLQILSNLLISTLHERQEQGQLTISNTFKPPPRVTLTDAKRESWLKDLSNPAIPLRRLSRTIPHGVRGKSLLEQCLKKDIPISRAIWLAKCVGANEIRAFKRKGANGVFTVGGEGKWIKEWTTNIEQFLTSLLNDGDGTVWRVQVDYGIRLAVHLFSEHLLDRDQYLGWLVDSIAKSSLETLATWILLARAHLEYILSKRRRGKFLIEVLLSHLEQATGSIAGQLYKSVVQELVDILQIAVTSHPACLLIPKHWKKYEHLIRHHVIRNQADLYTPFTDLQHRNRKLQDHSSRTVQHHQTSNQQAIIALFDSLSAVPNFESVAQRCFIVSADSKTILTSCLKWCSSLDRHGAHRIYAAARLIRLWAKRGVDVQGHILGFLPATLEIQGVNKLNIYKLISELVCSGHFSTSRYLQWLMAHGVLKEAQSSTPDGPCHLRLLFELPMHSLPAHVLNLRRSLLSKITPAAGHDDAVIEHVKAGISSRVPKLLDYQQSSGLPVSDEALGNLSQAVKCATARWMRQVLTFRLNSKVDPSHGLADELQTTLGARRAISQLLCMHFRRVLKTFISLGEFSLLADTMIVVYPLLDGESLTVMVDTINYYHDVFNALGASKAIFRAVIKCVRENHSLGISEQNLIESLIDLGNRLPGVDIEIHDLCKRLQKAGPPALVAACSPVSDTMMEATHSTNSNFLDEVDHTLATGSSIDRQTATRVFKALTASLDSIWGDTNAFNRLLGFFWRLQTLDPKLFKQLLMDWLVIFLAGGVRPKLKHILSRMICFRILSIADVLSRALSNLQQLGSESSRAHLAFEILNLVATEGSLSPTEDCCRVYRFCDERNQVLSKHSLLILQLFQVAIKSYTFANPNAVSFGSDGLHNQPLCNLLGSALQSHTDAFDDLITLDEEGKAAIGMYLLEQSKIKFMAISVSDQLSALLRGVDEFNILSSQLRLRAFLRSTLDSPGAESALQLAKALMKIITQLTVDQIALITYLFSTLPTHDTHAVRREIEDVIVSSILNNTPFIQAEKPSDMDDILKLVNAMGSSGPATVSDTWMERLSDALFNQVQMAVQANRFFDSQIMNYQIRAIVLLLTFYQSFLETRKSLQDTLIRIVVLLSCLLGNATLPQPSGFDEDIIDVLYVLSDFLNDDSRRRYTRLVEDHCTRMNPHLDFILDPPSSMCSEWLKFISVPSAILQKGRNWKASTGNSVSIQPFSYRRWEMLSDATPVMGTNDTSLSLALFGVKKSVL